MSNKHGDFIWYELITGDPDAAQKFYNEVVGWSFTADDSNEKDYRLFSMNSTDVGGVLPITPEMTASGTRPCWMGYIGVNDVDEFAGTIEKAGGTIRMKPTDVPNVGRMAMVADPQGVMFYIMKCTSDETRMSFASTEPIVGHCAWNELTTTNPTEAVEFYTSQLGWRQEGDMDMGPLGKYLFVYQGKHMVGGIMSKAADMPVSAWSYYFRVPDIDKAVATIKSNGGKLLQEPMEIPGGDFTISGMDPQGATFALVGART